MCSTNPCDTFRLLVRGGCHELGRLTVAVFQDVLSSAFGPIHSLCSRMPSFFTLSLVVLAVCVRRADRFPKITWLPSIIIQLLQKVSDREDRHAKEIRFKDADDAVKVAVQQ